eukprot:CAMPEP_0179845062 /NCGR_PEP_ID=MMETSP0982-20121206/4704_1 /TAXON_ID=483367 /ORGANISM="non described non described, Strain CCMP 2436" /LENGTH=218 /DNA_ID=CAMNT_0021729865 /DNA_START=109 /DNA_END=764 /DNA_ORIENTATION=-
MTLAAGDVAVVVLLRGSDAHATVGQAPRIYAQARYERHWARLRPEREAIWQERELCERARFGRAKPLDDCKQSFNAQPGALAPRNGLESSAPPSSSKSSCESYHRRVDTLELDPVELGAHGHPNLLVIVLKCAPGAALARAVEQAKSRGRLRSPRSALSSETFHAPDALARAATHLELNNYIVTHADMQSAVVHGGALQTARLRAVLRQVKPERRRSR